MNNITLIFYTLIYMFFIMLYFVYCAIKNQKNRLSILYSLMTFAEAEFTLGYALELMSKKINLGLLAIKYQYFGLAFLPIFWFIFSYKFYKNKYPNKTLIILISIIPIVIFFLVMTNELHYLYYHSVQFISNGDFFVFKLEKSFFYYIFIVYNYLILIFGFYTFYKKWNENNDNNKIQSKLLFYGALCPVLFNLLYIFGVTSNYFDPTPIGYFFMSYFYYRAIFEYDYFDLQELVRYSVFDRINEGIIVLDEKNRIIDLNTSATIIFPSLSKLSMGTFLSTFNLGKIINENINKDYFEISMTESNKNKYFEFRKNDIFENSKIIGSIYIFQEITNQKELINNLSYLATHDFLTDVHNRMNFMKLGEVELYRSKRYNSDFSLLMLDIDFFKKVNDNFGHYVGDEVLKNITKIISDRLRVSDIIARYGGEEFIILLPETSAKSALVIAEDIRRKVETSVLNIDGKIVSVTISIGLVQYTNKLHNSTLEQIINSADDALYEAKRSGRNKICTSYL